MGQWLAPGSFPLLPGWQRLLLAWPKGWRRAPIGEGMDLPTGSRRSWMPGSQRNVIVAEDPSTPGAPALSPELVLLGWPAIRVSTNAETGVEVRNLPRDPPSAALIDEPTGFRAVGFRTVESRGSRSRSYPSPLRSGKKHGWRAGRRIEHLRD